MGNALIHSISVSQWDVKHEGYMVSRKPDSIRRYVIKLQSAAYLNVQNIFIDVSTEFTVFIFRVHVELIGRIKKYQLCRIIARIVSGKREGEGLPS
jgi:hypothetical protein